MARSFGLGRGLDALIPRATEHEQATSQIPIDRIRRNPHQPRVAFDEEALAELATSIAEHGVIQPIVVRRGADGGYELVAGERRLRAARMAGLTRDPGRDARFHGRPSCSSWRWSRTSSAPTSTRSRRHRPTAS